MFLLFLIGGAFGFITALLVSFKKCAERGFMWEHYVPMTLQIVILQFSEFPFLSYVFGVIIFILLVKNVIGLKFYRENVYPYQ